MALGIAIGDPLTLQQTCGDVLVMVHLWIPMGLALMLISWLRELID